MLLVTTVLDGADIDNFQYDRKFYWPAVVHDLLLPTMCQESIKYFTCN